MSDEVLNLADYTCPQCKGRIGLGAWTTGADDRVYHLNCNPVRPAPTPADLTATLTERGSRYGTFFEQAKVVQRLKEVISEELEKRRKLLAPDQQEALAMICNKLGRIINGDPDYTDSWVDIAGYAKLVADRLEGMKR